MTDTNKRNVIRQKIRDIANEEPKDSLVSWAVRVTLQLDDINHRVKKLEARDSSEEM